MLDGQEFKDGQEWNVIAHSPPGHTMVNSLPQRLSPVTPLIDVLVADEEIEDL